MKSIETTYRGIKYRSRTEARWAAFFDAMRIDAVYEGEGFDLDGEWPEPVECLNAARAVQALRFGVH